MLTLYIELLAVLMCSQFNVFTVYKLGLPTWSGFPYLQNWAIFCQNAESVLQNYLASPVLKGRCKN